MATDVDHDELYDERADAITERVEAAYPDGPVVFSAYELDADELPIDNLDEIAAHGPVVFTAEHDSFFGQGRDYRSSLLTSPTWIQVIGVANESVACTGDRHHVFLEAVHETGETHHGARVFKLMFGS